jgi:hypothetical protein
MSPLWFQFNASIAANNPSFWGIFWVDVSSIYIAKSDFIALAKASVRKLTNESWTLILDNADEKDFDYHRYFSSGTRGATIMTSRPLECSAHNIIGSVAIEGPKSEDSVELLLKAAKLPPDSWPSYDREAKCIVERLGSNLLALV